MNPFKSFNSILELYIDKEAIKDLPNRWKEPHRFYHTENHLVWVLQNIEKDSSFKFLDAYEKHALMLAAFFHDVIYFPKAKDNEDQSIQYFLRAFKNNDAKMVNTVKDLIECTKYRKRPYNKLEKIFWDADNSGFTRGYNILEKTEKLIRKEFIHFSPSEYKKGRIEFLTSCKGLFNASVDKDIDKLIEFIKKTY